MTMASGLSISGQPASLSWLRPIVLWLRWGSIGLAVSLLAATDPAISPTALLLAGVLLVGHAAWQSLPGVAAEVAVATQVLLESLVVTVAVIVTGGWLSPYAICVIVPVLLATLVGGVPGLAVGGAFTTILVARQAVESDSVPAGTVVQGLAPLLLAAGLGLVVRRMVGVAEERNTQALGRLEELSHVNTLLATLHELVRSAPAPLAVEDVLDVVRTELDELFDAEAVVLLLADQGGRWWRPAYVRGATVASEIAFADLPAEVITGGPGIRPVQIARLAEDEGLTEHARSGAYLWLWSRGQPAALLALEHSQPRALGAVEMNMLARVAAPLGLAIDNAIWFRRLQALGAEEERQRIGSQLHDQFAQSLAYVNMELGRLATTYPGDPAVAQLQTTVQATLADLRETLRELRLRCTEDRDLVETLRGHVERFGERFGVFADVEVGAAYERPTLSVENQLLRIAQDLLHLAQRESAATAITISLATDPGRLRMVVRDDGRGADEERLGHEASRLLSVVRERADAIGALVDVFSRSGEGTDIAVTVRGLVATDR